MANVIAVANQKGGVGKTTTTVNLAFALCQRGQRVLAIDADPQASLTTYLGHDPDRIEAEERSLYFALVGGRPLAELVIPGAPALVASGIRLASAEPEMIGNLLASPQTMLRERVAAVRPGYDTVLIDCAPSLGLLTINGLVAADHVLIPAETEYLASKGVQLLLGTIERIRGGLNPRLRTLGVLPSKYSPRFTHDNIVLDGVVAGMGELGIEVFDPVPRSTVFAKASLEGVPVQRLDPNGAGAHSYAKLAQAVLALGGG